MAMRRARQLVVLTVRSELVSFVADRCAGSLDAIARRCSGSMYVRGSVISASESPLTHASSLAGGACAHIPDRMRIQSPQRL
jgi:hypothetical protein